MIEKTCKKYLDIPMRDNDADAKTIGEYLEKLFLTLWEEKDGFSGKRPFGNSSWEYEIYAALIAAGCIDGEFDEDGYIDSVDYISADDIIRETISGVFESEV